jgi:hypothetical protein
MVTSTRGESGAPPVVPQPVPPLEPEDALPGEPPVVEPEVKPEVEPVVEPPVEPAPELLPPLVAPPLAAPLLPEVPAPEVDPAPLEADPDEPPPIELPPAVPVAPGQAQGAKVPFASHACTPTAPAEQAQLAFETQRALPGPLLEQPGSSVATAATETIQAEFAFTWSTSPARGANPSPRTALRCACTSREGSWLASRDVRPWLVVRPVPRVM